MDEGQEVLGVEGCPGAERRSPHRCAPSLVPASLNVLTSVHNLVLLPEVCQAPQDLWEGQTQGGVRRCRQGVGGTLEVDIGWPVLTTKTTLHHLVQNLGIPQLPDHAKSDTPESEVSHNIYSHAHPDAEPPTFPRAHSRHSPRC